MKNQYRFVLFTVLGFVMSQIIGCAASVQTEQYVGEYEKEKSMDEVVPSTSRRMACPEKIITSLLRAHF